MDVRLVAKEPGRAEAGGGASVLCDPELALTRRYGMERGGTCLVRPDGYVAHRSRAPDDLDAYVETVLHARGQASASDGRVAMRRS